MRPLKITKRKMKPTEKGKYKGHKIGWVGKLWCCKWEDGLDYPGYHWGKNGRLYIKPRPNA